MRHEIIQTGSDGNATVVDGSILIDCGVSYSKLKPYVQALKVVLLTHRHGDHFKPSTVDHLRKTRPTLRWACCEWMVGPLLLAGVDKRNIDVFEPGVWYEYGTIASVSPFSTYHNVPNCGWRIEKNGERMLYATDLGNLDGIEANGYEYFLLEANHMEAEIEARAAEKLESGEFCYETSAAEYHLSYEQAIAWLQQNMGPKSVWIPMHGHKEKENGKQDHQREHLHE